MKHLLTLCLVVLTTSLSPLLAQHNQQIDSALNQLDVMLDNSAEYVAVREERIAYVENLLKVEKRHERVYDYTKRLCDEYFSYNFDQALYYAKESLSAAKRLNDNQLIDESHITIAKLYTMAGMYAEAIDIFSNINEDGLKGRNRADYYLAKIHFNRDFCEYSKDTSMCEQYADQLALYRTKLYNLPREYVAATPNYQRDSLSTRLLDYYDAKLYADALRVAEQLIELTQPTEHSFAIVAYYYAMIYDALDDTDNQLYWLIESAFNDVRLAIKDNASLCIIASLLSARGDIERAFRYIRISTDDAIFYNAKLRQWQVAIRLNTIEQAYHNTVSEQHRAQRITTIMATLMAVILFGACLYVVMLLRRMSRTQRDLRAKNEEIERVNKTLQQTNKRLSELNLSFAEANMVKEEYIALFLSMCSDYIDKIASMQRRVRKGIKRGSIAELNREFPSSDIIEAEKEHFYEVFDSAFLNLYPNFVEEMNSLLEPDGQIELKKGERLNTELRIFALIRLGISDSSKIALLLHYSVNTIYNYRAKVKNRARGNRDDFEQIVRTIGSFKQ